MTNGLPIWEEGNENELAIFILTELFYSPFHKVYINLVEKVTRLMICSDNNADNSQKFV